MDNSNNNVNNIVDELLIRRVLAEYCHFCDDGDFDALIACFAPDATFRFGRTAVRGHEALFEWFRTTQSPEKRGKHLSMNSVIDIEGDRARVRSDFVFVTLVDTAIRPLLAGRYDDELRRVDGRWVFSVREATTLKAPAVDSNGA